MEKEGLVTGKCVVTIIGLSISWSFSDSDFKYRRTLWKHTNILNTAYKLEEVDPTVGFRISIVYSDQGRWKEVERLEVEMTKKEQLLLGEDHPKMLGRTANLAITYRKQGRWNDAEALLLMVIEKKKWLLREDHPDTLSSMANLATRAAGMKQRWSR